MSLEKTTQEDPSIEIEYYTDPLCCWSWAFEPQWRRLRYEFAGKISWQYRMAGLLPSWGHYNDPLFSVNRPLQMGPVWMEAGEATGQPIHSRIWGEDPPASSYPACIAVKCAAMQSKEAEEAYLRQLRKAVMLEGKNISKEKILLEEAQALSTQQPKLLNIEQFTQAYTGRSGEQAFREDLQKVRYGNISRFPTLILKYANKQALMITGYRPYEVLLEALHQLTQLTKTQEAFNRGSYLTYWPDATEREVAEALKAKHEASVG